MNSEKAACSQSWLQEPVKYYSVTSHSACPVSAATLTHQPPGDSTTLAGTILSKLTNHSFPNKFAWTSPTAAFGKDARK
jgi:hypothetical protein